MNNKKIGIKDIVSEGKAILKECRKWVWDKGYINKYMNDKNITSSKKLTSLDYKFIYSNSIIDKDYEELHKLMIKDHHDFSSIYAIVVRHIVYNNEYYDHVMERYVNFLTHNPWNSKKEFIERQGEYMVLIFREKNPRCGTHQLGEYKQKVRKHLLEEEKTFEKYEKEVKETVNGEWDEIIKNRRDRIHDLLVKMKKT